jgi:hypothetical protein
MTDALVPVATEPTARVSRADPAPACTDHDYASLWSQFRIRIAADADYARQEARLAGLVRNDEELLDYYRYSGEADALARVLAIMDELDPQDYS